MRWNLEWLRTFKTIYEVGTLSAAAQELFMSQPGVSLHLNSLEAFMGYKLFERSARKMLPTEKGKMLYNQISEPLDKLESAEQGFNSRIRTERVTISVGMCFETFQHTLESFVSELPFNLITKFGDYHQMQHDLDNGLLDLIITPQKGHQSTLEYTPFGKEEIILIAGSNTDTSEIETLFAENRSIEAASLLKQQTWYSTATDMEHLKNFWYLHFNEYPNFNPNYIVPNISSIIRCLSDGEGFAVVPDFLCKEAIAQGHIRMIWKGDSPLTNTLYFGIRKKTMYQQEITLLKELFEKRWDILNA